LLGYRVQLRTVTSKDNFIMTNSNDNHGLDQAKLQAESIAAMVAAINCDYDRLEELRDEREALADAIKSDDDVMTPDEMDARTNLLCWDTDNAEELQALEIEAGECADSDEARENVQNDPLSVEVRSGWASATDTMTAEEFRIVLCTGGPHVEIVGELDNGTPCRAWLQYQDWGTPMTRYFDIEQSTLLAYCQEFYFEG
jgi:hypothetical protein